MEENVLCLDYAWKFHAGDIELEGSNTHAESYTSVKSGYVQGPGGKSWYDNDWRIVDLPHDYLTESAFSEDYLLSHGYRERKNAWYRKSFVLDSEYEGKELYVFFEGTTVYADFYFNGSLIARTFSGYAETFFDITERAYFDGRPNVLAVHIKGLPIEGWWYEGAGIYRHVKLYIKDKLHIAHDGIYGKPVLKSGSSNNWEVQVETTVENSFYEDKEGSIQAVLLNGEKEISRGEALFSCDFTSQKKVNLTLDADNPDRWDIDSPKLYTLKVSVNSGGETVDEKSVRIGFRTFELDADKGFFLNSRPLKIKGVCNHQDHAGVGVAVPDSVQYYRVKRLKEMGCNAYRCSHNPPAREILDACDEIGIIVMDENRHFETDAEDIRYLEDMVRRDRNHPSIIFWSLFNEEPLQNTDEGAAIYRRLKSSVLHLDDTRLLTGAINGGMEGAGLEMDVTGINYGIHDLLDKHINFPGQPVFGSENASAVSTRGCYKSDHEEHILSCYDEETVPWGQTIRETWDVVRKNDFLSGIFMWTGFDYRGEPSPFEWPSVSSQFGIMDTCGFEKDAFYFCKACFDDEHMVHLLPHWNHSPGEKVRVMAVTNCEEVELFLNGVSLGRKKGDVCDTPEWEVVFEPGTLSAKGYNKGESVCEDRRITAGEAYAIKLISEGKIDNDGLDTAIINCCVVDKDGVVVPFADNLLSFSIEGDGYIRGVGNGDPNSHESDVLPKRKLFNGWCQVLITAKAGGKNLTFKAEGYALKEAELSFDVRQVGPKKSVTDVTGFILEGFTVSETFKERPDVLRKIDDNDMNSFVPATFTENLPEDFRSGFRIYRVVPKFHTDDTVAIRFSHISFDEAEIYVDGECIDKVKEKKDGEYESGEFSIKAGEKRDIRVLLRVGSDACERSAGIAGRVELIGRT